MQAHSATQNKALITKLSAADELNLQGKPFFWLISVGKDNFEANNLLAQLDTLAERQEPCTVLVADTLQRFNDAAEKGISLEKAHQLSRAAGDRWLASYQTLIEQKKPNTVFVRWDTWLNHPDFAEQKKQLRQALVHDPAYEAAMQASIQEYTARQAKNTPPSEHHQALCREYLLEECTVLRLLGLHSPIKKILYPGVASAVIKKTLEGYPDLAWLALRFRRVNTLQTSIENPAFLKKILFHLPAHIYLKDKKRRYVWCNQAHLESLGLKKIGDIAGKTDEQLPWKSHAESLKNSDQYVLQTGQDYTAEETVQLEARRVFLSHKKALLAAEKIIGLLGVSVDITERKQAEEAKCAFLENMRHDIRTPLSGIIGLAEGIANLSEDEPIKKYACYIYEAGHTLLDFLNAILENIRLHEQLTHVIKSFNFSRLLKDAIALNHPKALEKNLTLRLENRIAWLISDPDKIQRILWELLSNALKFTSAGEITVSTALKKDTLTLSVRDTGIGIPLDQQPELSKPFTRMTPSWQGLYKGCGLGLNNVHKLLEDLNGHINITSEPEKGSCFECSLPLKEKPALLLIEDDPICLLIARNEFEKQGFEVMTAECLKEAFEKIRLYPYALIVTDLGLPDGSGETLVQKIRETDNPNHNTPVVALTAHADAAIENRCLEGGMQAVFKKPLVPDSVDAIAQKAKV